MINENSNFSLIKQKINEINDEECDIKDDKMDFLLNNNINIDLDKNKTITTQLSPIKSY